MEHRLGIFEAHDTRGRLYSVEIFEAQTSDSDTPITHFRYQGRLVSRLGPGKYEFRDDWGQCILLTSEAVDAP